MKLSTVGFAFAGMLAFVAMGAPALAVRSRKVAAKGAVVAASLATILGTRASVGNAVEWRVAATDRREERSAPLAAAGLHPDRSVPVIPVSVDDLLDRSRKAPQRRVFP